MAEHIVKSFGEELDSLSTELARMGGMAESMVADAVHAVVHRDPALAEKVIGRDKQVDLAESELERRVIRLFALRQPMAADLRATFAALKISGELERIGDLAKNIAKRSLVLDESEPLLIVRGVEMMGRTVLTQLKNVLDAYATGEIAKAAEVWNRDEDVDALYNSMFRELLTYMMEDPRTISAAAHLLFIAKNLERIGDHATNIAELIHFIVTGESPNRDRPKAETVRSGPDSKSETGE
jgi:phosphate transport system protein